MRRRLANFLLLSALLLCMSCQASAQSLSTSDDVRKWADTIVATGSLLTAISQVRAHLNLPADDDASQAQSMRQAQGVLDRYGPSRGYEFIRQEVVGASLLRLTYLAKFEKGAMRWQFIFYKADKGWVVTDFKFDTNRNALFDAGG